MPGDVRLAYVHEPLNSHSFTHSLLNLVGWDLAHSQRLETWAPISGGTDGLVGARNEQVRSFLKSRAEWLFWIDTDMGFAPDSLDRLLEVADPQTRPIVGGLCFAMRDLVHDGMGGRKNVPVPTIYDWDSSGPGFAARRNYQREAVVQCSATGSAFLVVHRSVYERIADVFLPKGQAWYDKIPLVRDTIERGRTETSEDLSFCMRAAAVGAPTFVHTGVKTTHLKNVWLGEDRYLMETWPEPATDPVAVIVPVLSRPKNVPGFMQSLRASTGLATAYFVCDPDDLAEQEAVRAHGGQVLIHDGEHGTFAVKANYGYRHTTEPWLLFVGDDVYFRPGWYDRALRAAGERFHVVATNDLSDINRTLAVHPLIRRKYIDTYGASWDGPGVVAHEGYRHCFVDNEWTKVAVDRGVFVAAPDAVVEHLHPLFRKGEDDDVYRQGQLSYDRDCRLWEKRSKTCRTTPIKHGFSVEASVAAYERQWHTIPDMVKVKEDLDRYEFILEDTEPEVIVECGTWTGRSAVWFAEHGVDVVTVDVDGSNVRYTHPRVTQLVGSSTDPEVVEQVKKLVDGRRCMVILDSDHSAVHVAAEIVAYSPLVSPGCFMVVEDGICRWVPDTPCTDAGPLDAIEQFVPRPGWELALDVQDMFPVTHHPGGWLRRVA